MEMDCCCSIDYELRTLQVCGFLGRGIVIFSDTKFILTVNTEGTQKINLCRAQRTDKHSCVLSEKVQVLATVVK